MFIVKIRKIVFGFNVVFVNVGYEKDVFLYYYDFGLKVFFFLKFVKSVSIGKLRDFFLKEFLLEKEIDKNGGINNVFKNN